MATYPASSPSQVFEDSQIWDSLKMAIASSSGFQSWQMEHQPIEDRYLDTSLDYRVQRYLRETLETLAY